jgi:hypothetical protein
MSVTAHIGCGAVKQDAPLINITSRIPFSETHAAGDCNARLTSIHKTRNRPCQARKY